MTKEIGKFGNSIGNEFNKVGKELGKTLDPKNWKMPDLPPALKLIPGVGLGNEFIKNSIFKNFPFKLEVMPFKNILICLHFSAYEATKLFVNVAKCAGHYKSVNTHGQDFINIFHNFQAIMKPDNSVPGSAAEAASLFTDANLVLRPLDHLIGCFLREFDYESYSLSVAAGSG